MTIRPDRDFDAELGQALRGLPLERPPASAWPRLARELGPKPRRARLPTLLALAATLALAAAIALMLGRGDAPSPADPPAKTALADAAPDAGTLIVALGEESAQLESLLAALASPEVSSASHAALRIGYTRRLQLVDQLLGRPGLHEIDRLALWQERVGLLRQHLALESGEQQLAARGGEGAALVMTL